MQNSKCKIQTGTSARGLGARALLFLCILHLAFCITGISVRAQQQPGMPGSMGFSGGIVASNVPPQFKDVTFKQRLGDRLPLDVRFKDESGRDVALGEYFGKKPVVLSFVYYQCPMLCTQVLNGISSSLKVLPFTAGKEFDVVLVSFDPRDTPEAANAKKRAHLDHWNVRGTSDGWHFLTGDEDAIRRVTSAAGFTYQWDVQAQQFAPHSQRARERVGRRHRYRRGQCPLGGCEDRRFDLDVGTGGQRRPGGWVYPYQFLRARRGPRCQRRPGVRCGCSAELRHYGGPQRLGMGRGTGGRRYQRPS